MTPAHHAVVPAAPKRRRWWVYALWLLGLGFLLVATLVVSAFLYWNHLVRTYTSLQPRPVPVIENLAEKFPDLKERWDAYALLFLHPERSIPEFELSTEDLNVFAARALRLGTNVFVEIRDRQFRVQFSAPLERTGNPSLQGRYLNGVLTLTPRLAGGHLDLEVTSLEANGRPIPAWILRELRKRNLAEALNRRPEFDLAIRALERIELSPDKLVLQPRPPAPPR